MTARSFSIVFRRELRALFLTPIGYIVIALFLVVMGWFFFSTFFLAGRADLRDFFSLLPIILSFTVPATTMRLFAEERRSGSYEILMTLPVTGMDVLLAKYASAVAFTLISVAPTLSYPLFISGFGDLDWGPVVGGYVGAALLVLMLCGIGILASALTRNQIVAFIVGLVGCAFFTMVDRMLYFFPAGVSNVLQYLAAGYHFRSVAKGLLDSRDIVYFLSMAFLAIFVTNIVNEERR
jgi:ABC-2 type transport system permease protein